MSTLVRRTTVGIWGPRTHCAIRFQKCFDLQVLWNSTQKLVICQYSFFQCALMRLAGRRDIPGQSTALTQWQHRVTSKLLILKLLITGFSISLTVVASPDGEEQVVTSHNQKVLLTPPNPLLNLIRKWGQHWQKQWGPNDRWRSNWLWEIDSWRSGKNMLCQVTFIRDWLQPVAKAAWGRIAELTQAPVATSHNHLESEVAF